MLKALLLTLIIGLLLGRLSPLSMAAILIPSVAAEAVYLRFHAHFSDVEAALSFVLLLVLGEAAYAIGMMLTTRRPPGWS